MFRYIVNARSSVKEKLIISIEKVDIVGKKKKSEHF